MAAESSVSTSRLPGSISRAVTALRNIARARSRRLVFASPPKLAPDTCPLEVIVVLPVGASIAC